jgi:hypothetical protein
MLMSLAPARSRPRQEFAWRIILAHEHRQFGRGAGSPVLHELCLLRRWRGRPPWNSSLTFMLYKADRLAHLIEHAHAAEIA